MKKALVLNTDWQNIEKSLREEFGYVVHVKDTKEDALEWCRNTKIDLIVGSFHMGIIELSGSLAHHINESGSAFYTQNPSILLTWHPDFYEDRFDDPELGQSQFNLNENGDYEHKPNELIEQSGIPTFKKPFINEVFNTVVAEIESNKLNPQIGLN
jgi:hypothetical protein